MLLLFLSFEGAAQISAFEGISKKFLLGETEYRQDPGFVKVHEEHSAKTVYLDREVYEAFIRMYESAQKEGITLTIVSGTRNFQEQKLIWERKWRTYRHLDPQSRTEEILKFSSMPATSRHHWGTDIDLNNLENSYFESGKGKKEYDWLTRNAERFGFAQVYTPKGSGRSGYAEEKWHWSYLPLAHLYLKFYNEYISYEDIEGFAGSYLAAKNNMIADYVNGISEEYFSESNLVAAPETEAALSDSVEKVTDF